MATTDERPTDGAMLALCRRLPKVELHAHLAGSARVTTIAELAPDTVDRAVLRHGERTLDECFAVFAAIHATMSTTAVLERVTREVLADFAADNVKYLELRTTPRALADADTEAYVRVVLGAFAAFDASAKAEPWPMVARLLLSIDRTQSLEAALATVTLAIRLRDQAAAAKATQYIVGIDFSGNPTRGDFATFAAAFHVAREAGLACAVHVAEQRTDVETDAILAFRPERLGHALCLHERHVEALARVLTLLWCTRGTLLLACVRASHCCCCGACVAAP